MHRDDRSGSCRSLSPPIAKPEYYKGYTVIPEIHRPHAIISRPVATHVVRNSRIKASCTGG